MTRTQARALAEAFVELLDYDMYKEIFIYEEHPDAGSEDLVDLILNHVGRDKDD
jgi:hypothetical protein